MNNQVKMIRAEIERYVDSLERNSGMAGPFGDAQMALCDRLLSFIDGIGREPASIRREMKEHIDNEKQVVLCFESNGSKVIKWDTKSVESAIALMKEAVDYLQRKLDKKPVGDLDNEFNRFLDDVEGMPRMWHSDEQLEWGKDIARHFAQWQKQQLMKDVISMNVNSETEWDDIHKFLRNNLDGDKVKLVIIKEE